MENSNPFKNPTIDKVLRDYTQFPNRVLTSKRGVTKTFRVQQELLDGFFKHGTFFSTIRESQTELDTMLREGFWDNNLISKEPYNKHVYRVVGTKLLIDNKVAGVAFALKTYGKCRMSGISVGEDYTKKTLNEFEEAESLVVNNIQNLRYLFFDEFEPINPQMTGELRVKAYRHITSTLFRLRDAKENKITAFLCGNLERGSSAMLNEFNFKEPDGSFGIRKSYSLETHRPLAVWAHLKPTDAWERVFNNSYTGLLTEGKNDDMFKTGAPTKFTDFRKIEPSPYRRYILCNLKNGDTEFTFWGTRAGLYHITKRTANKSFPTFAFDIRECRAGIRLIDKEILNRLLRAWNAGQIQFDSSETFENFIAALPARRGGIV